MTTATNNESRLSLLSKKFSKKEYDSLNEKCSFGDYLDKVGKNPFLVRTAYQRIHDMIIAKGTEPFKYFNKTLTRYKFFDDDQFPIFGLEQTLEQLVKVLRSAAGYYGTEKRIILLHGPVGSSKSTICRLLKKEMEKISKTDDGAWYSFEWTNIPNELDTEDTSPCPMHEDPINLLTPEMRAEVGKELNDLFVEQYKAKFPKETPYPLKFVGELCPRCKLYMRKLLEIHNGDWHKVVTEHIRVKRMCYSESDRVGIGTFQPKDEKNQDSTELSGDINFRKLGEIGVDSDPRAFSFDGEFNIANRGLIEFIEMLKLDKAFLYDLLGAAQERQIKPKKFPQVSIDLAIIAHTNNPEFKKIQADKTMEALKDRTIRIDVPYLLQLKNEIKVIEHGLKNVPQHIAPHTVEIAALWAILTRLKNPKDKACSLVEKAELYNGKMLSGWNEDRIKEMTSTDEGLDMGISVRYVQNKISSALVGNKKYINPFMVLNEIQDGLTNTPLLDNEEDRKRCLTCVTLAKTKLEDILKKEVQDAVSLDGNAMERLCTKYMQNVYAHLDGTKIDNPFTQEEDDPDERLMRAIEEKIDIPEQLADDFRRKLAAYAGSLSSKGQKFDWKADPKLMQALEKYAFEQSKDGVNIAKLNAGAEVVNPENQDKIDTIRQRLMDRFGYNEESATDVMNYVSSIWSRQDVVEK